MSDVRKPIYSSIEEISGRINEISQEMEDSSFQRDPQQLDRIRRELDNLSLAFDFDSLTGKVSLDPSIVVETGQTVQIQASSEGMRALGPIDFVAEFLLVVFTTVSREERICRYHYMRSLPGYTRPVIVAEGDSWFDLPIPRSGKDVVDWLGHEYAVFPMAAAGATIAQIRSADALRKTMDRVDREKADILLFSAGGNDLLGGRTFSDFLKRYPGVGSIDYFKTGIDLLYTNLEGDYRYILSRLRDEFGTRGLKVIGHRYDYSIPRLQKPTLLPMWPTWMGTALRDNKYPESEWNKVAATLIDKQSEILNKMSSEFAGFFNVVNTIGAVGPNADLWFDEIHPRSDGFRTVAGRFKSQIDAFGITH